MGYFSFGEDGQRLFDAYPYGGLGEYMTAPQENCIKLPDTVSFEQGARFGYLGTAYSALKKAKVGPGKTVLIDGASRHPRHRRRPQRPGDGRDQDLRYRPQRRAPRRREGPRPGPHRGPRRSATVLKDFVLEHNGGEGVDAVISTLGPGSPKETLLEALSTLARGGVLVDIGGMMEHPELDLFHMMCSQNSVIGSLWFTNGEAQEMSDLAGSGALDLSVLEHHVFPLEKINEALDDGLPARHGGFSNFIITPDQSLLS